MSIEVPNRKTSEIRGLENIASHFIGQRRVSGDRPVLGDGLNERVREKLDPRTHNKGYQSITILIEGCEGLVCDHLTLGYIQLHRAVFEYSAEPIVGDRRVPESHMTEAGCREVPEESDKLVIDLKSV
jgi:hypothetical protein